MPESLPGTGIPIPLRTESATTPADLKRAFLAVNNSYVLRAKNTADRDAKFPDALPGTVVTGTAQDALWRKKIAGGWSEIWGDTGWKLVTSFQSGWAAGQQVSYRVLNGVCYWRGSFSPAASTPEQTWTPIVALPADARPSRGTYWPASTTSYPNTVVLRCASDSNLLEAYLQAQTTAYVSVPPSYPVN